MATSAVLSTSKVNPLSSISMMRRAKGQSEGRADQTQFQSQLSHARKVDQETVPVQLETQPKSMNFFSYLSTLAMLQSVPQRTPTSARLQEYATMAASIEQDIHIGLGATLDMHA